MADPRYWPYIEATEPACTQALIAFAREVLLRRPAMLTWIESEAAQAGHTYTLITADQALEISATRVPFSFWQYETAADCEDVPPPAADDALVWQFLRRVHAPNRLPDERLASYEPYYWQAASQLGAPAGDEAPFADLLLYPGLDAPINLIGPGKTPTFDPAAMQDLADWMASDATAMLFIYGENDPWTAAACEPDASRDVHRFIAPGGNHGAEIAGLTDADRALAHERLEAWTGVARTCARGPPRCRCASPCEPRLRHPRRPAAHLPRTRPVRFVMVRRPLASALAGRVEKNSRPCHNRHSPSRLVLERAERARRRRT